jgi:hypothetical protein
MLKNCSWLIIAQVDFPSDLSALSRRNNRLCKNMGDNPMTEDSVYHP